MQKAADSFRQGVGVSDANPKVSSFFQLELPLIHMIFLSWGWIHHLFGQRDWNVCMRTSVDQTSFPTWDLLEFRFFQSRLKAPHIISRFGSFSLNMWHLLLNCLEVSRISGVFVLWTSLDNPHVPLIEESQILDIWGGSRRTCPLLVLLTSLPRPQISSMSLFLYYVYLIVFVWTSVEQLDIICEHSMNMLNLFILCMHGITQTHTHTQSGQWWGLCARFFWLLRSRCPTAHRLGYPKKRCSRAVHHGIIVYVNMFIYTYIRNQCRYRYIDI